ncbi:hypothetical protein C8A01DRAFT_48193 [Parachaetomium inaequale]|uniref:Uncharacterized protein n=1 Tax=Parachaetomium inaequale TaxID=2588326 RepID=A0AAN6SQ79_9PEZI|nr:hypothetical protein C8A01DRAFT_48193 [Parachaetomium inaequale]
MNGPNVNKPPPTCNWREPVFVNNAPPKPRRPPGRLRLGPHAYNSERTPEATRLRFRTRILHATATSVDGVHQNVRRLRLQPSAVQTFLGTLVRRLPSFIQAWFESCFPEWNLPDQLILKKYKEDWDEEFDAEKAAYAKLQPWQGVVIPRYYGEVRYHQRYRSVHALLLSDIGDACLASPEGALLEMPEFRRLLSQALTALAQFRVQPDDVKLDNIHLAGDRIMVLLASDIKDTVDWMARLYEDTQYCYWDDGFISVENCDR